MFSLRAVSSLAHRLLQSGEQTARICIERRETGTGSGALTLLLAGVALYGASIGAWHGWQQAAYVAIKLPVAILLTLVANAFLNGVLAILLGVRLSILQTSRALLASFAVFGLVLASLSPITLGMALDAPSPESGDADSAHRSLLLAHTVLIAFAGLLATTRLYRVLVGYAESSAAARRSLVGLLAGNLFAGAQVGFLLRPIFGQPGLAIEFLRPDAFDGNFYESVWWALTRTF